MLLFKIAALDSKNKTYAEVSARIGPNSAILRLGVTRKSTANL